MMQNRWFTSLISKRIFQYNFFSKYSPIITLRKGYTKNRLQIHNEIIRKITGPCRANQPSLFPIAILVGGGTASGKTVLRKTLIMNWVYEMGWDFCFVDADEIKAHIPEYHYLLKEEPKKAASFVHKESIDIRDKVIERIINHKCSFIYEGTMAKKGAYQTLVKNLHDHNYSIHVWIADIPVELAFKRAKKREKETGRKVPIHVIQNTHKMVPRTFHAIKEDVDEYYIFDNQKGFELIYSKEFINKKLYSAFCSKAGKD